MRNKPRFTLIGENGNIFNLMARVRGELFDYLPKEEAKELVDEMVNRVTSCKSYEEALVVLQDYYEEEGI